MNGQQYVPPHDIFGAVSLGPNWGALAVLILVAAIFGWFVWWYWTKSRHRLGKTAPAPAPTLNPGAVIWQRFEALTPGAGFEEPERQAFYGDLTEIARMALARRLGDPVAAATTAELAATLAARSPLSIDDTKLFLRFLEAADHVKFARRVATREEALRGKEEMARWLAKILPRSEVSP